MTAGIGRGWLEPQEVPNIGQRRLHAYVALCGCVSVFAGVDIEALI